MKNMNEKIREERKRQRHTLKSLAELSGVSWRTIYLVEKGRVSPSVETLTKIAKGLGFGPAEFLT